jgi:hypothetical protein
VWRPTLERSVGSHEGGWCGCSMGRGDRWTATGRGLFVQLSVAVDLRSAFSDFPRIVVRGPLMA